MNRKNVKYEYSVEVVGGFSHETPKKPKWQDMIGIASHFEKRQDALDFIQGRHMNHIGARFFLVTFRSDKSEPARITEVRW